MLDKFLGVGYFVIKAGVKLTEGLLDFSEAIRVSLEEIGQDIVTEFKKVKTKSKT